jgi:cell division protein ZapA
MPELTVTIGGRAFPVACQEGEERFLRAAAAMLDAEAQPLIAHMGRLPEAKMLLMAGLMLADKTAAVEDEIRTLKARLADLESRGDGAGGASPIPPKIGETLAEIAAQAEALAQRLEDAQTATA